MVCKFSIESRALPSNCLECPALECYLPGKRIVQERYRTRRHPKCPLVELADEEAAAVEQILAAAERRKS